MKSISIEGLRNKLEQSIFLLNLSLVHGGLELQANANSIQLRKQSGGDVGTITSRNISTEHSLISYSGLSPTTYPYTISLFLNLPNGERDDAHPFIFDLNPDTESVDPLYLTPPIFGEISFLAHAKKYGSDESYRRHAQYHPQNPMCRYAYSLPSSLDLKYGSDINLRPILKRISHPDKHSPVLDKLLKANEELYRDCTDPINRVLYGLNRDICHAEQLDPRITLSEGVADCKGFAVISVCYKRASGIPTRFATAGKHILFEEWDGKSWIIKDPYSIRGGMEMPHKYLALDSERDENCDTNYLNLLRLYSTQNSRVIQTS